MNLPGHGKSRSIEASIPPASRYASPANSRDSPANVYESQYQKHALLQRLKGQRELLQRTCEYYRQRLNIELQGSVEAMFEQSSRRWYQTRILELEGAVDGAEKVWKQTAFGDYGPIVRAAALANLGRFYLRQGRPDRAVKCFESVDQLKRRPMFAASGRVANKLDWSLAQWAAGKRRAALRNSLHAAQLLLNDDKINRNSLASSILIAHILVQAGVGTETERKETAALLERAVAALPPGSMYSVDPVLRSISTGNDLTENAARVATALKSAPYLDWALWAAMYQGLAAPGESAHLLDLLSPDTIQGRIAAVHTNKQQ